MDCGRLERKLGFVCDPDGVITKEQGMLVATATNTLELHSGNSSANWLNSAISEAIWIIF